MNNRYLKRKIDDVLMQWKKDADKSPLIIKGCRQIGKTESIKQFARNSEYESIVEINFYEEPKYKGIIHEGYSTDSIIKNISLIDPSKKFIPGKTLIFFDEITEFPEIATSLKFFNIDQRFDVICSGSLLGANYNKIESNSVGYKTDYEMYSLDFEEFLWSCGYNESHLDNMLNHMINCTPFSENEMLVYHQLFLEYIILGGMPSVINKYISNKTFTDTLDIQRKLINGYKEDIRKYAVGIEQTKILNVFNSIPIQLAKENKTFQLSKISKDARSRNYRGCIEWLKDSGIINSCYALSNIDIPLSANYDINKFKLYFNDTGLLISQLDDETQDDLRVNKNLGTYKGAIYENIVAEALTKLNYKLFYYKKDNSTLEEDFLIRNKGKIVPIEVKATNGTSKSLQTLIANDKYKNITYGIKLSKSNIGFKSNIFSFPYFCTFLLRKFLNRTHLIV